MNFDIFLILILAAFVLPGGWWAIKEKLFCQRVAKVIEGNDDLKKNDYGELVILAYFGRLRMLKIKLKGAIYDHPDDERLRLALSLIESRGVR